MRDDPSPLPPRRGVDPAVAGLALVVTAACVLLHGALGPRGAHWTIDNGGKALVVANLLEDPSRTWLRYPGASRDPALRWFPQPLRGEEPYGRIVHGRVASQYLSPFSYLALPFARLLGWWGLIVLPALGAGAAVLLTGLAGARAGRGTGRAAAAILAAGTPLLFYGSVFWEHTLVTALGAGAFLALADPVRARPLAAGLCLAAAGFLREECFLLAAGAGGALLLARRGAEAVRLGAAAAGGVLAHGVFSKLATGSWAGIHVSVNPPVPLAHAGEALRGLLFSGGFSGAPSWSVVLLLAILAAARVRGSGATRALGAAAIAALAAVSLLGWFRFPGGQDEVLALIRSNSAALFVPWALVAVLLPPGRGAYGDVLAGAIVLFTALFAALVPERSITGVHPGPRMLLPALPAAAVLLAERFPRRPAAAACALAAVVASLFWSARSLAVLAEKREAAGQLAAALRADPRRVVATDLFWLPTELSALWDSKEFHYVNGQADFDALARAAAPGGVSEMLFVTAPGGAQAEPVKSVRHSKLPEFSADFYVRRLGAERRPPNASHAAPIPPSTDAASSQENPGGR